jgi:hypothetical protein
VTFGAKRKHLLSSTNPGNILMVLKGSIFYHEPIPATYLFIIIDKSHNHTSIYFHGQSCQTATFKHKSAHFTATFLNNPEFTKFQDEIHSSGPRHDFSFKKRVSFLSAVTTRAKNRLSFLSAVATRAKCLSSKVLHCIVTQMNKTK